MKVAIVLPAFNEELTIRETISGFHNAAPNAAIYVVDNRSADRTAEIARDELELLGCAGGVLHEMRPGKGNAIRKAFRVIEADIFVMADADLTYPPQAIDLLIALIASGQADMAVGDRISTGTYKEQNQRPLHNIGNRLVISLVNFLFKSDLKDIMSGYRAFSRRFVKNYPILVEGFELETDMTLHALDKRYSIVEVPIEYYDRPDGSFSKLNTLSDGYKVVGTISRIFRFYRPLQFFVSLAVLAAASSALAAAPVLMDWFEYQYIYRVPLAVLATGLALTSLIFLAIGLILDGVAFRGRQEYEQSMLGGADVDEDR